MTIWGGLIAGIWGCLSLVYATPIVFILCIHPVFDAAVLLSLSPLLTFGWAYSIGVNAYFSGRATLFGVLFATLTPLLHLTAIVQWSGILRGSD